MTKTESPAPVTFKAARISDFPSAARRARTSKYDQFVRALAKLPKDQGAVLSVANRKNPAGARSSLYTSLASAIEHAFPEKERFQVSISISADGKSFLVTRR